MRINELTDVIAQTLFKLFPSTQVWTDAVTQGLTDERFDITIVHAHQAKALGVNYVRKIDYAVRYYASVDSAVYAPRLQYAQVVETLFDGFNILTWEQTDTDYYDNGEVKFPPREVKIRVHNLVCEEQSDGGVIKFSIIGHFVELHKGTLIEELEVNINYDEKN